MIHPILFSLGAPEIILIVLVLLLLFGGKKIPELMRGLGQGMKEFKKAVKEDDKSSVTDDTKASNKENK
jgi:sec-independent protein translocase protein TatA